MYIKYIIAICIVIIIIILAIHTSNLVIIPFGICIFGLLGASIYYNNNNYKYGTGEKSIHVSKPKQAQITLLDNWYKLSNMLYYQSYPHVVTKIYSLIKSMPIFVYIDIKPYTLFGTHWIFRELSSPPIINKITSLNQLQTILQNYTNKYPKMDAVLYQEIEDIIETISVIYTITVQSDIVGSLESRSTHVYNNIISSVISSNILIPDKVIDLFKYIAVVIDTCVYVPSTLLDKNIIKQYKIDIVKPNPVPTDMHIITQQEDIVHANQDYMSMYNEYLIVNWIPLTIPTNKMKFNIPISTIKTSNKSMTYIFDMIRFNQRDFLKYTTENKWRRIDINIATSIDYIVDLQFYSNNRSRLGTAISKMPARVKSHLFGISYLSNKIELHESIITNPKLVKYIPESIIILHQKIDPNNKNNSIIPTLIEPWIWRPEKASLGWGIEIVISKEELNAVIDKYAYLNPKYRFVLSRYITNPKLIKNADNNLLYKFHVRLHLIISIDKQNIKRFLLVNTGEMFVSSTAYINKDYNNTKIHDTHYDKFNNSFFPDDFPGTESEKNILITDIRTMFKDICSSRDLTYKIKKADKCESGFHIFGADIMITDENKPILLEINRFPGLPDYTDLQYPNDVTRLSKEFYSGLWDTVINPLVTGAPIVKNHKYITLLHTSN
jgi:hypothetical protein